MITIDIGIVLLIIGMLALGFYTRYKLLNLGAVPMMLYLAFSIKDAYFTVALMVFTLLIVIITFQKN